MSRSATAKVDSSPNLELFFSGLGSSEQTLRCKGNDSAVKHFHAQYGRRDSSAAIFVCGLICQAATKNEHSSLSCFSMGDLVPIAYSRIDPEQARIDTPWFSHRWAIGGMNVGLAIVIRALAGADLKQN